MMYRVTDGGDADYYFTYGVTATEVELDVLTGQIQIPRVDILYDCGNRCCTTLYLSRAYHFLYMEHESQD